MPRSDSRLRAAKGEFVPWDTPIYGHALQIHSLSRFGIDGGRRDRAFYLSPARRRMETYEWLIGDAMMGDASLFAGQDGVEASWRVVNILRIPTLVHEYEPRTW